MFLRFGGSILDTLQRTPVNRLVSERTPRYKAAPLESLSPAVRWGHCQAVGACTPDLSAESDTKTRIAGSESTLLSASLVPRGRGRTVIVLRFHYRTFFASSLLVLDSHWTPLRFFSPHSLFLSFSLSLVGDLVLNRVVSQSRFGIRAWVRQWLFFLLPKHLKRHLSSLTCVFKDRHLPGKTGYFCCIDESCLGAQILRSSASAAAVGGLQTIRLKCARALSRPHSIE